MMNTTKKTTGKTPPQAKKVPMPKKPSRWARFWDFWQDDHKRAGFGMRTVEDDERQASRLLVWTTAFTLLVALVWVADGDDASRLLRETLLVVPVADIPPGETSETSTITNASLTGSVPVPMLASAVILESGMI